MAFILGVIFGKQLAICQFCKEIIGIDKSKAWSQIEKHSTDKNEQFLGEEKMALKYKKLCSLVS